MGLFFGLYEITDPKAAVKETTRLEGQLFESSKQNWKFVEENTLKTISQEDSLPGELSSQYCRPVDIPLAIKWVQANADPESDDTSKALKSLNLMVLNPNLFFQWDY